MSQLADAAQVSRSTLYRCFRSRQEVERALSDAGVDGAVVSRQPRERCLDAVQTLATTVGLPRMTLDAVAEQAGVGIASVYRIFGNRRGLLEAFALERSPRSLLEAVLVDDGGTLEESLETLVGAVLKQVFEQAPWLMLAVSADDESRELASELIEVEREGRARLTTLFERFVRRGELHGEPRALSQALLSLAAGRAVFAKIDGAPPGPDDARALVQLFLAGARARSE